MFIILSNNYEDNKPNNPIQAHLFCGLSTFAICWQTITVHTWGTLTHRIEITVVKLPHSNNQELTATRDQCWGSDCGNPRAGLSDGSLVTEPSVNWVEWFWMYHKCQFFKEELWVTTGGLWVTVGHILLRVHDNVKVCTPYMSCVNSTWAQPFIHFWFHDLNWSNNWFQQSELNVSMSYS